ncbi:uncharacterized protein LOC126678928 [Mercurialis annua]|uniref:uncharacterized protein LOC126678928 n=1 Tax=Mercurialis annua TaxID=3986 RepID=UPI00215E2099|nr:uncharacterized protein LOC126678928 [Mercurialis annua]
MTKPQNKGCFSSIARLLLCKRSLQTHPTDQNTEPNTTPFQCDRLNKDLINIEVVVNVQVEDSPPSDLPTATTGGAVCTDTAPPGVVARLMGLNSLPKTNWVFKGERLLQQDLATRSRSANFMDYVVEFDLAQADDDTQQRRVRTSVSFREVPTFSNQEKEKNNNNHDVLVLYLEENNNSGKFTSRKAEFKLRKPDSSLDHEEIKQNEDEKNKNDNTEEEVVLLKNKDEDDQDLYESDESRKLSAMKQFSRFVMPRNKKKGRFSKSNVKSPEKPMNQKEAMAESKFMKKFKNQLASKDVQSECSSEESSPVSVLDLDDYFDDELPCPDYSSIARSTRLSIDLEPKEITKNEYKKQSKKDSKYYTEIVKKLCKLIEEDIKETKWVAKEVSEFESVEEICSEFGQEILDTLVKQVVEELVGFHLKSFIDGKVF